MAVSCTCSLLSPCAATRPYLSPLTSHLFLVSRPSFLLPSLLACAQLPPPPSAVAPLLLVLLLSDHSPTATSESMRGGRKSCSMQRDRSRQAEGQDRKRSFKFAPLLMPQLSEGPFQLAPLLMPQLSEGPLPSSLTAPSPSPPQSSRGTRRLEGWR
eukprot:643287-Hanusia_phi.AAC.1